MVVNLRSITFMPGGPKLAFLERDCCRAIPRYDEMLCRLKQDMPMVEGTQTSLSASDTIQPSSCMTHGESRLRLVHTRTDLSREPETIRWPSGENATEVTSWCVLAAPSTAHRLCIPHPHRFVQGSRDDLVSVRRECDRIYPVGVQ
jgi:hypothetical protein